MVGSWHGWVRVILEISRLIDSWTFSGPTCFFVYTFVCSFVELCPSKISKCMKADGFMRHGVKKEHQNPSRHFSCSSSRGTRLCINTIVFSPQQITKNMRVCFFLGGGHIYLSFAKQKDGGSIIITIILLTPQPTMEEIPTKLIGQDTEPCFWEVFDWGVAQWG